MRKHKQRCVAAIAAGGILLSLALSGAGQAATLKTGYYSIDHMAMAPDSISFDTNYGITWASSLYNIAADVACFNTAVNLPQGATVTGIMVWYGRSSTGTVYTGLLRHAISDGHADVAGEKLLGGTNGVLKSVVVPLSAANTKIDNARYSYGFGICLKGERKDDFRAARITYTYLD